MPEKKFEMKYSAVVVLPLAMVVLCLITPTLSHRINSKLYIKTLNTVHENAIHTQRNENSIAYVKASIPIRIFQCMQRLNIMKCMKIFILQRMERTSTYVNSGNLTADFLDQVLTDDKSNNEIFDPYYVQMNESVINERLLNCFQRFFKNREIKLHFIPGMVVKVVPSAENSINMSVKRGSYGMNNEGEKIILKWLYFCFYIANADLTMPRKQKEHSQYLLQFGVPALIMPAIIMGTVLPFVLPMLKMATIVSGLINNGALISAVLYAAKNAALMPENKVFYNPGSHRNLNNLQ